MKKIVRIYLLTAVMLIFSALCTFTTYAEDTGVSSEETPVPSVTPLPTEVPQPTITPEPTPTVIPTPSPTPIPKSGLVKEGNYYRYYKNGKPIKSTWKTISSKKYYFKSNGNAAVGSYKINGKYYVFNAKGVLLKPKKDSFVTVGTTKYYISPKGNPVPGWHIIDKKLYYVGSNGKCAVNTKKDGITFTKNGYAKNDTESKLKIKVMTIISQITKPSMTKSQKLWACWNWCNNFRFQIWKFPDFEQKDWTRTIALDMINTRSGNCYGLSSTFGAFAKELGYTVYLVDTGTHCWNEINGTAYDGMFPNKPTPANAHPRRNIVKKKFKY